MAKAVSKKASSASKSTTKTKTSPKAARAARTLAPTKSPTKSPAKKPIAKSAATTKTAAKPVAAVKPAPTKPAPVAPAPKLKSPPPKAPSIKGEKRVAPPSPRTEPIRLVPAKPSNKPIIAKPIDSDNDIKIERKKDKKKLPINNPPVPPAPVSTDSKPKKNQMGLSSKELEHFRDMLLAKRRELVGDMSSMEREALRSASGTNLSNLPLHMADMGTDNYEQEFTLGIVEKDRGLVREINQALAKIQNGTYGTCEGTGKPIAKPRLEAQPWAKFSIEHARAMEKRRMQF